MNEQEMSSDCQEFVILCIQLREKLDEIKASKYSQRVWAAVCSQKIIDLCKECQNPEKAFKQIIECLEMKFEEQVNESVRKAPNEAFNKAKRVEEGNDTQNDKGGLE